MKIYKIAQIRPPNKPVAFPMPLQAFVNFLDQIKANKINAISIRDPIHDPIMAILSKNQAHYHKIDNYGLENLYVATFDDLETDAEQKMSPEHFPKKTDVHEILAWAKKKWEENHRPFVIHCTGGVSRSSAIAILINQMIMGSYEGVYDPKYHSPNRKILNYGEEFLGVNNITPDIDQKEKAYNLTQKDEEIF